MRKPTVVFEKCSIKFGMCIRDSAAGLVADIWPVASIQLAYIVVRNYLPPACRQRGYDLKDAVDAWQAKHGVERVLTTGFLDGTHPIVDTYELKVWTRGTWCGPYTLCACMR